MKRLLRIGMLAAVFVVASGVTYVAVNRWNAVEKEEIKSGAQRDILDGVGGLNEGEVVTLPQLTTLSGDVVNLGSLGKERLLFVFVSNRCPGCTRDADLWRDLHNEAPNRAAAFYVINVGDERAEVEQFVAAYHLEQLSVLFDPRHKVGPRFRVGFLPQYILFDGNNRVIRRWDGIRQYNKNGNAEQLAEFFQPH